MMAARQSEDAAVAPPMRLGDLLGAAAGEHAALAITDLVLDSRHVTPGAAFVAVQGERAHGVEFAADALARGAAIVLYEPGAAAAVIAPRPSIAVPNLKQRLGELARAFFGAPPAPLLAVTGTNGKTTVAWLLAQAESALGRPCGYVGTLGYGVPPSITPHALTTPDCFTLHRELRALGVGRAALEVSSHALAQDRIAGLELPIAVLTNLTRDHLDAHGDFASYGEAKARRFTRPGLTHAVLNANDPFAAELARRLAPGVRTVRTSVGARAPAELTATIEASGLDGLALAVKARLPGERPASAALASPLIGDFNAENLLLAVGVLVALRVPLDDACAALGKARPAPGRVEVVAPAGQPSAPNAPTVVVDYAHTPDALERVLATLKPLARGALWCVFGCGGDRDRGKRPQMGAIAARAADHIVLTDDNPRSEDPAAIVAAIRAGVAAHPDVTVIHDREAAIRHAIGSARPGDLVLVAGKGHETVQIVGRDVRAFDDRAVARAALEERR